MWVNLGRNFATPYLKEMVSDVDSVTRVAKLQITSWKFITSFGEGMGERTDLIT